jgi:orotate phosphoribosyltransferase
MLPMLNIDKARAGLLAMFQTRSVVRGDFTLSSGAKSNYYIGSGQPARAVFLHS